MTGSVRPIMGGLAAALLLLALLAGSALADGLRLAVPAGVLLVALALVLASPPDDPGLRPVVLALLFLPVAVVAGLALAGRVQPAGHAVVPLYLPVAVLLTLGTALMGLGAAWRRGEGVGERHVALWIVRLSLLYYVAAPALTLYYLLLDRPDSAGPLGLLFRFVLFAAVYGIGIGLLAAPSIESRRKAVDFAVAPLAFAVFDAGILKEVGFFDFLLEWSLLYVTASLVAWAFFWIKPALRPEALRAARARLQDGLGRREMVAAGGGILVVVGAILLPLVVGSGAVRLMVEEALARGLLAADFRSLLPFLLIMLWVTADIARGFDAGPADLRAPRPPKGLSLA